MRRALLVALILCGGAATAQPYGNEWINYGRQYWRFNIAALGLYRIDSTALANAGFPVTSVDPREIQVFGREREVPIYVQGEDDGVFNTGDFIEFFADRNDAWKDVPMWEDPSYLNNPHYSLFNDTIRYFITWAATPEPLRVEPYFNTDYASYPQHPWFLTEYPEMFTAGYQRGERSEDNASLASFGNGEGWFHSSVLNHTGGAGIVEQGIPVPTLQPYLSGPNARATIAWASANDPPTNGGPAQNHHSQLRYTDASYYFMDTLFSGYRTLRRTFDFPASYLNTDGTTNITLRIIHDMDSMDAGYSDRQVVSYAKIRYPRSTFMEMLGWSRMWMPDDPGNAPMYHYLTGVPGTPVIYAFNSDTVRRVTGTSFSGGWQMLIPQDPVDDTTRAYYHTLEGVIPITAIEPVTASGYFTDFTQAIVDSAVLIVSDGVLMNAALQYAAYRETSPTNPCQTLVADVDELYDQYSGGIERHPWGIRAWCDQMLDELPTPPQGLFLIGKSVQMPRLNAGVQGYRHPLDVTGRQMLRVPSFGYPCSDNAFTLGLLGDPKKLDIPVGRLAAQDEQDVLGYLEKVQAFEDHTTPEPWMKNILHFGGGFSASEQDQFLSYLSIYESIAEDTSFAGNVTTFRKSGTAIISMASADSVYNLIDEGVSLMTFFGHATGNGFDINIDNVGNYQWNGRFPAVVANSCYSGNIHLTNSNSSSEQFVLPPGIEPTHGAIAFFASVDVGYGFQLFEYTNQWYRSFSQVNYGRPIGTHIKYAGDTMLYVDYGLISRNTVELFTLHGDPMLVLNSFPEPDFAITGDDITFTPSPVTADVDSFDVSVAVTNIGRGTNQPVTVKLERTLQDGTDMDPLFGDLQLHWRDSLTFTVPVRADSGGLGNNTFHASVDLDPDVIPEMEDLSNNEADKQLLIASGDIMPAWPYEFAITPDPAPTLKATTLDPFAPVKSYYFQVDTTDAFNSPMLQQTVISAPGGVVSWDPPVIYNLNTSLDSVVYFWRVSRDTAGFGAGNYNWFESSFQCLDDRTGWGQSHFFQFEENGFNTVQYDKPARRLEFDSSPHNLNVDVWPWCNGADCNLTEYRIDLDLQEYGGCQSNPAWTVCVIDQTTLQPWYTNYSGAHPDNEFGQQNCCGSPCRNRDEAYFIFRYAVPSQVNGMENMLLNNIPDGDYLLVYTWRYLQRSGGGLNTTDPDNSLENTLVGLGATNLPSVGDSVPYIFFVRKGFPATAEEVWGTNDVTPDSAINLSVWINALGNQGTMHWPMAGPAYSWDALYWDEVPENPEDSTRVRLTGVRADLTQQFLFDQPSEIDSVTDLEIYTPDTTFPWLNLTEAFFDDSALTPAPAQPLRWQLLGNPAPECAIDPPSGYFNDLGGLYEGQDGHVAVAVRNISDVDMDSLLITAWVTNAYGSIERIHFKRNPPLPAGGIVFDTIDIATGALGGVNYLRIEANGIDTLTGLYDQLEQTHVNNIAELRFEIEADEENPVLDVTFDGIHILDNDIVSTRPEIRITLDDENPTLLFDDLADTTHFRVFLTDPGGTTTQLRFFNGPVENMQFVPATGADNICHILYRPVFTQDGIYTLQVRANDISFNESGDEDYEVRFEVIGRPTITSVLNYPNPFTTATHFVFTITGDQPPDQMKIQIYTVSGRVVRTIDLSELGPLHVGRNITDYAWDGTDDFGDRLARGVYLYRVFAKLNGTEIEHRETQADGYFTKGFGKMYLLR